MFVDCFSVEFAAAPAFAFLALAFRVVASVAALALPRLLLDAFAFGLKNLVVRCSLRHRFLASVLLEEFFVSQLLGDADVAVSFAEIQNLVQQRGVAVLELSFEAHPSGLHTNLKHPISS